MTRVYHTFPVDDSVKIKQQMLNWANQFNICCFLDNHNYSSSHSSVDCIVGAGTLDVFEPRDDFFASLSTFIELKIDWLFGHFSYDLKNIIEPSLTSPNPDYTCFPDHFLFVPEVVLQLHGNELTVGTITDSADEIFDQVKNAGSIKEISTPVDLQPRISRDEYLRIIAKLQEHIKRGDCYEINFCQEFFAHADIDPLSAYTQLSRISPNPFSAFYKLADKYVLCASPERYIKKEGDRIISQPIKGTAARNISDPFTDKELRQQLFTSTKDRSENVMVVDLVRNDLSKVCKEGTVVVDELFGVYTFPQVYQMISTVCGVLEERTSFGDILKATFPMGSMTGAPKQKVMQLIDTYEQSNRGVYSGAIGYISPQKNFDFNVVIRSLIYNQKNQYLSFHAGSAITSYSDPEKEYEECRLKGKAIMQVFTGTK